MRNYANQRPAPTLLGRHSSCMSPGAMKLHTNTGVDDREQWRARIMRALQELQGEDSISDGRLRLDENRDDAASDAAKV